MNAIVMKRKIIFGVLLLLASSSVTTWAMEGSSFGAEEDNSEKTFVQKLKKKMPSFSQAAFFCIGAAYPLWCVTHDSATLSQYSKMSLRRGLWGYGIASSLGVISNALLGSAPSFGERLKDGLSGLLGFLASPDAHYMLFAPTASRGIFFRGDSFVMQFVIPSIYSKCRVLWSKTPLAESFNQKEHRNTFYAGSFAGSLLGIGIRYRKDFATGFRQTPQLVKQLPQLVKTLGKYIPEIMRKKQFSR